MENKDKNPSDRVSDCVEQPLPKFSSEGKSQKKMQGVPSQEVVPRPELQEPVAIVSHAEVSGAGVVRRRSSRQNPQQLPPNQAQPRSSSQNVVHGSESDQVQQFRILHQ